MFDLHHVVDGLLALLDQWSIGNEDDLNVSEADDLLGGTYI